MYAFVNDGTVEAVLAVLPPSTGTVSGFDLAPPEVHAAAGYFPLVENRPPYDPLTEELAGPEFVIEETKVVAVYMVRPRDPQSLAGHLLAAVADHRFRHETAGITVSGMRIDTDRDAQAKLTGAALSAMRNPAYSVRWKGSGGLWGTLDAPTVLAMADAVRDHVQSCYDAEALHAEAIAVMATSGDLAGLAHYDITTGWPLTGE